MLTELTAKKVVDGAHTNDASFSLSLGFVSLSSSIPNLLRIHIQYDSKLVVD